jgi:DAK2 domain fusion protein YloV
MTPLERLDADALKRAVGVYRDVLRSHQEALNRLNVYPVPDGDTGTNMALTLESVVAELDGADAMPEVCKAISHGSLMGARGNSGVILSQILRGIAAAFERVAAGGAEVVADGLRGAADAAYKAVMRPVEGTILTVARAAGEAAFAYEGDALVGVLDRARSAAADALARTPELLPVLKQAGVVDAGGAGFVLLLDALLAVVDGRPLPVPDVVGAAPVPAPSPSPSAVGPGEEHHDVGDLRYEVMFFLEAPDDTIDRFKDVWMSVGDSIVVVGGDGIYNCHIHTDDIGAAIEAALDCGRPSRIRVTDLGEQVEEERWVREGGAASSDEHHEPVPCAVVAVATGDGIRRIFRSLGVHQIVAGGQSMNPSTSQILEAVEAAPADEVVVLPNNKNIVAVAEQVDAHTTKTVRVVATTSIAEGFAALLEYDPQDSADANLGTMREAATRVVSGEVTRAVRASTSDAGPIAEGDYLGLAREGIKVVHPSLADAACGLLDALVTDAHEIVTVIEGDGATAAVTRHVTEWLAAERPAVTVEVHHGGQPLYPYLFSIE